ncbi:MAG TPA: hypothetical protein VFQ92_24385, partial [Blastocatellia bacterium]|nr:hypothetical protein [Blastocatellia bacterium]
MRQRIELLAMTKLELADMVTTELAANPVLEEAAPGDGPEAGLQDDIAAIDATTADYAAPESQPTSSESTAEAAPQEETL